MDQELALRGLQRTTNGDEETPIRVASLAACGSMAGRPPAIARSLTEADQIASGCGTSPSAVRHAVASWVLSRRSGKTALRGLAIWDPLLAAWCACAIAEAMLKHVPRGEDRPREAIRTARKRVLQRLNGSELITEQKLTQRLRGVQEAAAEYEREAELHDSSAFESAIAQTMFHEAQASVVASEAAEMVVTAEIDAIRRQRNGDDTPGVRAEAYWLTSVAQKSAEAEVAAAGISLWRWEEDSKAKKIYMEAWRAIPEVVVQAIREFPAERRVFIPSSGSIRKAISAGALGVLIGGTFMFFDKRP